MNNIPPPSRTKGPQNVTGRVQVDQVVHQRILGYKPRRPDAEWARLKEFVVSTTVEAGPATVKKAREMMHALTSLASWAETSAGLPLTRKALLKPEVVNRFMQTQTDSPNSRHVHHRLLRVIESLGGERSMTPTPTSESANKFEPYSARDITAFSTTIQALPSVDLRRNAMAVMGFVGGAGLRREELASLTLSDVTERGNTYEVAVSGSHPRKVLVRQDWVPYVRRALKGLAAQDLLFFPGMTNSTRNRRYKRLMETNPGALPRMERLRMTWLASLINTLPLGTLMHVAGYSNASSFWYLESLLSVMPDEEIFDALSHVD